MARASTLICRAQVMRGGVDPYVPITGYRRIKLPRPSLAGIVAVITETPPPLEPDPRTADEREMLLGFLRRQRRTVPDDAQERGGTPADLAVDCLGHIGVSDIAGGLGRDAGAWG